MYFSAPGGHNYQEREILNALRLVYFKSSKCDFWISQPKKLTHAKFQDERMTD